MTPSTLARIRNGIAARLTPHGLVAMSGLAIVVVTFLILVDGGHWHPGDVVTYLAAGERLNAGHPLYALSPGDRVLPIVPPFWTVPLLSPPLIAVIWRPLALLPETFVVDAWWAAMVACLALATAMIVRRPSMAGPVALYILSIPLALEAYQGNINALLLLGSIVAWRAFASGRPEWAGGIIGVLVALKVTPAVLAVWVIASCGRRGLIGVLLGGGLAGLVSLMGAGFAAHLDYLSIIRDTTTVGSSDLSLAGMLRILGLAPELAMRAGLAVDVLGIVVVVLLRHRPGASYRAAIITMVAGSPVVFVNTYVLLLPTLAPRLWSIGAAREEAATTPVALAGGTVSAPGKP